jgi:uncharacterized protein
VITKMTSETLSTLDPAPPLLFSGKPKYVPRSPWGSFTALLVTAAIFGGQLIGVLVAAVFVLARAHYGGVSPDFSVQTVLSLTTPTGVAIMLASQLTSVVLVWLFANRAGMRDDVLRLNPPKPTWTACLVGGILVVALTGAVELVLYGILDADLFTDTKWLVEGLRSSVWWGTVIAAVVLAPLWEELTFRGFLLSALAQTRLGFWGGALISNVLWTSLHATYSIPGLASVFTAGLVLSWLMWRTGSIRAPIIAHGFANLIALVFTITFAPGVPIPA